MRSGNEASIFDFEPHPQNCSHFAVQDLGDNAIVPSNYLQVFGSLYNTPENYTNFILSGQTESVQSVSVRRQFSAGSLFTRRRIRPCKPANSEKLIHSYNSGRL